MQSGVTSALQKHIFTAQSALIIVLLQNQHVIVCLWFGTFVVIRGKWIVCYFGECTFSPE